jgi:hypothetical protein
VTFIHSWVFIHEVLMTVTEIYYRIWIISPETIFMTKFQSWKCWSWNIPEKFFLNLFNECPNVSKSIFWPNCLNWLTNTRKEPPGNSLLSFCYISMEILLFVSNVRVENFCSLFFWIIFNLSGIQSAIISTIVFLISLHFISFLFDQVQEKEKERFIWRSYGKLIRYVNSFPFSFVPLDRTSPPQE